MAFSLPTWARKPGRTLLVSGTLTTHERDTFVRLFSELPFFAPSQGAFPITNRPSKTPLAILTPRGHDAGIRNALRTFQEMRLFSNLSIAYWWDHRDESPMSIYAAPGVFVVTATQNAWTLSNHPGHLPSTSDAKRALRELSSLLSRPLLIGDSAHARLLDAHNLPPHDPSAPGSGLA